MENSAAMKSSHAVKSCVVFAALLLVVACNSPDDYRRAKTYLDQGDLARAEQLFLKAAAKDPKDARPLLKLATIYFREEKFEDAARTLEKARALVPEDGEIAARLALALQKSGRPGDAATVARKALQLDDVQKDKKMRERLEKLITELESEIPVTEQARQGEKTVQQDQTTTGATGADRATTETAARDVSPCAPLPTPPIKREDLAKLIPSDAPGRVIIRWRTETQEENLGFNIYRSENPEGPYQRINRSLIPGEGSTNIPKDYCFEDKPLPRGKVFYYYIETVSVNGVHEVLEGTKGTRVKVKTVEEEREWLWKKVMGEDHPSTPTSEARPVLQQRQTATTRSSTVAYFTLKSDQEATTPAVADPIY
ncbi:MAG: tetratricopeptide repeat protein [Candidatus Sumerlaeaceae bacterium]|jgi:hypothetical protein